MNKKGVEPAVAIAIIIAVAITIAIAVAYWILGLIPSFTRFEELKITNAYIDSDGAHIIIKNVGSTTVTISDVFVNGEPAGDAGYSVVSGLTSLDPGENVTVVVSGSYLPGVVYLFEVKTATGGSYPISLRAS